MKFLQSVLSMVQLYLVICFVASVIILFLLKNKKAMKLARRKIPMLKDLSIGKSMK